MLPSSRPFVVIAEFRVRPGALAAFLDLAHDDARSSVAHEPGCRAFDVAVSESDPLAVVFYEVYDDRAAFDTHLTMPHFQPFSEALERLNVQRIAVRFFTRQHP
jgi:quinol monooxygenase YgiN